MSRWINCQAAHHLGTTHCAVAHPQEAGAGGRVRVLLVVVPCRVTTFAHCRAISIRTRRTVERSLGKTEVRVAVIVHQHGGVAVGLAGEVFPTHSIVPYFWLHDLAIRTLLAA